MHQFTVVMPLYNKAGYVVDSVCSVLAQEFNDLELIVVDDGSTDGGVDCLVELDDPRLTIIRQPNAGVSAARNLGILRAGGVYITFLDADDLWSPMHLVHLSELIDRNPLVIAWATGFSEFDDTCTPPQITTQATCSVSAESRTYSQYDFLITWGRSPLFCTGSIAIRASTLRALQPCFPIGERLGEDQDLWFRLSALGPIRVSSMTTTTFYRRGVGNSLTAPAVLTALPAMLRLLHRSRGQSPRVGNAMRQVVSLHMLHVAWANCVAGRRTAALRFLRQASPSASPVYWTRILLGLLLPNRLLKVTLAWIKSNRIRRVSEL